MDKMHSSDKNIVFSEFFSRLQAAANSLLLLDYDGTLAPFQKDRASAYPYPEVISWLENILDTGKSNIIIVTGRAITELRPLLHPLRAIEIWGSHGMEHLAVDGTYRQTTIPFATAELLSNASSWLTSAGLASRTEIKPGGLAVHWRGLSPTVTTEIYTLAHSGLKPFIRHPELKLLEFDGGVELRVAHPHKGDAITSALSGIDLRTPVAYLGDDHTDEAAFRVLKSRGLTALVREEYRTTNAQIWLRPVQELIGFLQLWRDCVT